MLQDTEVSSIDTSSSTIEIHDCHPSFDMEIHCGIWIEEKQDVCLNDKKSCEIHNKKIMKRAHLEHVENEPESPNSENEYECLSDDSDEVFPTEGPYLCQICQVIKDTKLEFLEHIKAKHKGFVDEEVLKSLESDVRKSRKKSVAKSIGKSSNNCAHESTEKSDEKSIGNSEAKSEKSKFDEKQDENAPESPNSENVYESLSDAEEASSMNVEGDELPENTPESPNSENVYESLSDDEEASSLNVEVDELPENTPGSRYAMDSGFDEKSGTMSESSMDIEMFDVENASIKIITENVVASKPSCSKSKTKYQEPSTSTSRVTRSSSKKATNISNEDPPQFDYSNDDNDDDYDESDDEVTFKNQSETPKDLSGLKKIPTFEQFFPMKDISKMSRNELEDHCQELANDMKAYKWNEYHR